MSEELRDQLAEALYGLEDIAGDWPWAELPEHHRNGYRRRAVALLPVVERHIAAREKVAAAEVLEQAASAWRGDGASIVRAARITLGSHSAASVANWLSGRAKQLRASVLEPGR